MRKPLRPAWWPARWQFRRSPLGRWLVFCDGCRLEVEDNEALCLCPRPGDRFASPLLLFSASLE